MRARVKIAIGGMLLAATACVARLPIAGSPCPCPSGYCCDATDRCAADEACGGRDASVDAPPRHYSELSLLAGSLEPPAFAHARAIASCFDDSNPNDTLTYLCVGDGHRLLRLTRETGDVRVIAGSNDNVTTKDGVGAGAGFGTITDITSDHQGLLYVIDGCLIRKVTVATGDVTTITKYPLGTCGARDVVFMNDPTTGPSHLYYCPIDEAVFVADGSTLRRISRATEEVTTINVPPGQFGASGVGSVTCDGDHLLIADGTKIENAVLDDQGVHSWVALSVLPTAAPDLTSISAQIDHLYMLQGSTVWSFTYDSMVTERCFPAPPAAGPAAPSFGCPAGLAAGLARDVYVTDPCTHSVRSLDCDQHSATALGAGPTLAAVNGPASQARFAWPTGLTTEATGDVFVVDLDSVRRISASHAVSTLTVGAVVTAPNGSWPISVVSDGAHTLYVADAVGNTVRKIATDTGVVSALVAPVLDGVAQLPRPTGLAIDRQGGKLYVGDVLDHTIRSVDTATGRVTLVAGQPYTAGSADGDALVESTWVFPSGLALDGQRLFVADAGAMTLRALDLDAHVVTTIAGAAGIPGTARGPGKAARFLEPIAVALDGGGNLFVVDRLAGTVCSVGLSRGEVTNVATIGGGAPAGAPPTPDRGTTPGALPGSLYLPQGIAFGPSNELLLSVPNAVVVVR
jgi:sugar lactone lactonase YvrE